MTRHSICSCAAADIQPWAKNLRFGWRPNPTSFGVLGSGSDGGCRLDTKSLGAVCQRKRLIRFLGLASRRTKVICKISAEGRVTRQISSLRLHSTTKKVRNHCAGPPGLSPSSFMHCRVASSVFPFSMRRILRRCSSTSLVFLFSTCRCSSSAITHTSRLRCT